MEAWTTWNDFWGQNTPVIVGGVGASLLNQRTATVVRALESAEKFVKLGSLRARAVAPITRGAVPLNIALIA